MKRVLLITSVIALAACQHKAIQNEKTVTPVKVAAVGMYQPKNASRYSATILPGRQVSLAFRVSGFVTGMYQTRGRGLEAGDMVPAGAVLARLRQDDYKLSMAQAGSQLESVRESHKSAAAQLAQVQASLAKAEADFGRAQILFDSKSLVRPDLDSARAQRDVALAQVNAARAQLDVVAANIRNAEASVNVAKLAQHDTALVAPFAATVVQRNIEIGMLAGPSQAAYSLADINTVKAAFGVPDTVLVQVKPGRAIAIEVEALPDHEFRGTVSAVASVADSDTRLFQIEVAIPNSRMLLKPGMIASLTWEDSTPAPPVPVVPLGAVVRDRNNPDGFAVMVVENKVARSRKVALGPTFGERLAVTSGLKPGELVIRAGGTLVNDGESVEVLP